MKEEINTLLEDALPLVNFDSDFLIEELDSLGVTSILMILADKYGVHLDATDVTPKNFKSVSSLADMVERKLREQ